MMELTTKYDSRKSFYRKAHYRREGERIILRSYSTDVSTYDTRTKEFTHDSYSRTTSRHQREFQLQIENGDIR